MTERSEDCPDVDSVSDGMVISMVCGDRRIAMDHQMVVESTPKRPRLARFGQIFTENVF